LPWVVDICQMHISWKQGIQKLFHTLLDSKKMIWCPTRLPLGAMNNVYKIPLYPTFLWFLWFECQFFFKVVTNYMVISNIPTSFFQFSPNNIFKTQAKMRGHSSNLPWRYTFLAKWSLINTKILPHISKTLSFKIMSFTNFCSNNVKFFIITFSLIFLITAMRIWLSSKKINTWTLSFFYKKNFKYKNSHFFYVRLANLDIFLNNVSSFDTYNIELLTSPFLSFCSC